MRIEVTQLPPVEYSPNWRGHWARRYRAGRVYQGAVYYSCVDARTRAQREGVLLPFTNAVINLCFIFPQYRHRDRDNLIGQFKPGLDAIVQAGLLLDDDAEHLQNGEVNIIVNRKRAPLTIIELKEGGSE